MLKDFFKNYISYNLITGYKIKTLELDKTPNFLSKCRASIPALSIAHIYLTTFHPKVESSHFTENLNFKWNTCVFLNIKF